jgi:hypothetical protein
MLIDSKPTCETKARERWANALCEGAAQQVASVDTVACLMRNGELAESNAAMQRRTSRMEISPAGDARSCAAPFPNAAQRVQITFLVEAEAQLQGLRFDQPIQHAALAHRNVSHGR